MPTEKAWGMMIARRVHPLGIKLVVVGMAMKIRKMREERAVTNTVAP
jgi:hypothetical protein